MCFYNPFPFLGQFGPPDPLDNINPSIINWNWDNWNNWNTLKRDSSLTLEDKTCIANSSNALGRLSMDEYLKIKDRYWIKELRNNPNAKRKIVFPNEDVLTFQNNDDIDNIYHIRYKIQKYIEKSDFDSLRQIQKFYIYPLPDMLINIMNCTDRYIPYGDEEEEEQINQLKAIISLSKKFEKDEVSIKTSVVEETIDEYVCLICRIPELPQHVPENHRIEDKGVITQDISGIRDDDIVSGDSEVKEPAAPKPTTLFNNEDGEGAIEAGRVNLVYSAQGVGKSYFAIEVAKSPLVKNPLYIMLDDISDEQTPRIKHPRLQDKITLIDYQEWKERCSNIKENEMNKAHTQAQGEVWDQVLIGKSQKLKLLSIYYNNNRQVTKREEEIMKSLGFEEKKVVRNVLVLESVLKEAVKDKRDLIIIDSLQGLLSGYINHLTYDDIEEITEELIENKITLILLHHENEQGKSKGSKTIIERFPYVYRLRADDTDKTKLYLDTEKARSSEKKNFIIERRFEDKYFATHTIISVEKPHGSGTQDTGNLADKIEAILDTHTEPTISRESLEQKLRNAHVTWKNETSITNALTYLSGKGFIKKADDKTWKVITIIGKSNSIPEKEIEVDNKASQEEVKMMNQGHTEREDEVDKKASQDSIGKSNSTPETKVKLDRKDCY